MNITTGIFKAPRKGIYQLTFHANTVRKSSSFLAFVFGYEMKTKFLWAQLIISFVNIGQREGQFDFD